MAAESAQGQLARRVVREVLNDGDPEAAAACLAEDIVVHGLASGTETDGREAFLADLGKFHRAVPDSEDTVDALLVAGDAVAVFCTRRGTHTGPLVAGGRTFAPTKRRFEVSVIHRLRIEDGRVAEWWRLADALGMARQLGLLPSSPAAALGLVYRQLRHRLRRGGTTSAAW